MSLDKNTKNLICKLLNCLNDNELIKYTDGLVEYYPDFENLTSIATINFKNNITAKLMVNSIGEKLVYLEDSNVLYAKRNS